MKAYEWVGVVLVSLSALGCGAVCGDGELSRDEACDDGNVLDADGCEANCSLPACANGIVDPGELCLTEKRFPMTIASNQIASGDLNGDGLPELAMVVPSNAAVSAFFNEGNGSFSESLFALPAGRGPQDVLVADFSGDGLPDLVTANQDTDNISVLLNAQNQPFTQEQVSNSGGTAPFRMVSKNLDGQTGEDLIVRNNDAANELLVLLNNGAGALNPSGALVLANVESTLRFAVDDLDNDGAQDVLVTGNQQNVSAFFGLGDGSFEAPVVLENLGENLIVVGASDLDGDGFRDILVTTQEGNLFIFANEQARTFAPAQLFTFALQGNEGFFVVDFDNDGRVDFVNPRVQNGFDVCLGNGDGTFDAPVNFTTSTQVEEIVVQDFNGDDAPDVAFTDGLTSELVIFFSEP